MKRLWPLLFLILAGCSADLMESQLLLAEKKCTNNGGVYKITTYSLSHPVLKCKNKAIFYGMAPQASPVVAPAPPVGKM